VNNNQQINYCGKYIGVSSKLDDHDGYCRPIKGQNCYLCRLLQHKRAYCGNYFQKQFPGHNGICGPKNGP